MTLYANMLPFFVLSTLIGAGYLANTARTIRRPLWLGAVIGGLAGLAGPFIFMWPLDSCTFGPETTSLDYYFGLFLFFVGAAIAISSVDWLVRLSLDRQRRPEDSSKGLFRSPFILPLLLLAPTLAVIIVFIYYPAYETFRLSTLLVRLGAPRTRFVCVRNFTELIEPTLSTQFFGLLAVVVMIVVALVVMTRREMTLSAWYPRLQAALGLGSVLLIYLFMRDMWSDNYADVFFNTMFISVLIVAIGLVISLAIAYAAFQPIKGASVYRTLLIWPYAISPAVAGILFDIMFDPNAGIIDHILNITTGIDLPLLLQDAWLARWVIIIASVWKTLGYNILFYLAGLQNVPNDLIEAAAIDGANAWQRFINVVVPALSPITFFLIITNLTYAFFDIFGTIDYLTKGAPAGATSVAIYEIFRVGIENKDLGRGAAQSIILFLIVIGVTIWQFRTSGRRVTYGA